MFKNESLNIFKKGNFQKIDGTFLSEAFKVLAPVSRVQKQYGVE